MGGLQQIAELTPWENEVFHFINVSQGWCRMKPITEATGGDDRPVVMTLVLQLSQINHRTTYCLLMFTFISFAHHRCPLYRFISDMYG